MDAVVCAGIGVVEDSVVVEVVSVRTEVVVLVVTAETVFCVVARAVEVAPGVETVVTAEVVVVKASGIVTCAVVVMVSVLEGPSSFETEPVCT